ncbi:MAG TPA: peptide chain release factor N(5)-glutamine methyltransferase [Bacteroidia bacterium]|nr:peptide chain release factor N(5)-glutamine methyltransferase [Bacteroidia bacterium]HNT79138.1 peptide chain release factor N(5)-glutamine methyltransferase [Bacteroidia bacterium]
MKLMSFINKAISKLPAHICEEEEKSTLIRHWLSDRLNLNINQWIKRADLSIDQAMLFDLEDDLEKIKAGMPLQYIIGKAYFFDMELGVNNHVLIPRPETEELVQWIMEDHNDRPLNVLEIGTGSGCISIAIKRQRKNFTITAIDISEDALSIARQNSNKYNAAIHFKRLNFLTQQDELNQEWDIIVSNPPYLDAEEIETHGNHVIKHEPKQALIAAGSDPLIFYRSIAAFSQKNLSDHGACYVELNSLKADSIQNIFEDQNFGTVNLRRDISGNMRMLRSKI